MTIVISVAAVVILGIAIITDDDGESAAGGAQEGVTAEPAGDAEEGQEFAPDGVQTFTTYSGWADEDRPFFQYLAYYPDTIQIHAGDTVTFQNRQGHTVTFGAGLPGSPTRPRFARLGEPPPPIASLPCVTEREITTETAECPDPPLFDAPLESGESLPEFAGSGFYNTGILPDAVDATITFSASTPAGQYQYVCLIHPEMAGTIDVVSASEPRQSQQEIDAAAQEAAVADTVAADELVDRIEPPDETTVVLGAMAGAEDEVVSLNFFFPGNLEVPAGTEVVFVNNTVEPHTVAFGEAPTPADLAHWGPATLPAGSEFVPGMNIFSGLIDPVEAPPYISRWSLVFSTPGQYLYVCTIHPGMAGAITVVE
jgi:plastocyanin